MAYFRTDGTADVEQKKFYRDNGTADVQIGKIYRGNGTADSLLYSAEETLYNNGKVVDWNYTVTGQYQYFQNNGTSLKLDAYNTGFVVVGWYVDVTGYDTLTLTGSGASSTDGWHGVAVTSSKVSSPSSRLKEWSGSGTWTCDISSYSGYKYVSVICYAHGKEGTPSGYYGFTLKGLKLT